MAMKIVRFNCCGMDVHKTWLSLLLGSPIERPTLQNTSNDPSPL